MSVNQVGLNPEQPFGKRDAEYDNRPAPIPDIPWMKAGRRRFKTVYTGKAADIRRLAKYNLSKFFFHIFSAPSLHKTVSFAYALILLIVPHKCGHAYCRNEKCLPRMPGNPFKRYADPFYPSRYIPGAAWRY
ncbi:hypothetical protein SDC9_188758 [bioreactor metagenome]|uniref:Uncharacterized protein n=1 Tax=bioreactor metagenome TaxID=1076179 RepID=A0A645HRK0_9ZZZZ